MIKSVVILVICIGIGFLILWGIVKLFFTAKREFDIDHHVNRQIIREMRDTEEDLEDAIRRFENKDKN